MSSADSVTRWIQGIKEGDHDATQKLLERYFQQLIQLAHKKLQRLPHLADYDEDVALSAFDSFVRRAEHGQFPRLFDRDELWRLLVVITLRKAIDVLRKEGGAVHDEEPDIEQILSREPPPELALEMAEEYRRLLDKLGDEVLRSIAIWKMEGYTNDDIASRLACRPRTVERRLHLIRQIWEAEISTHT